MFLSFWTTFHRGGEGSANRSLFVRHRTQPPSTPFEIDPQKLSYPALCLASLAIPPTVLSPTPFPTATSAPIDPPSHVHLELLRASLLSKIAQWKNAQLSHHRDPSLGHTTGTEHIEKLVRLEEDRIIAHLDNAFHHWVAMPPEQQQEVWKLELYRAYAKESERRHYTEDRLARVQQEADTLRTQLDLMMKKGLSGTFAETAPIGRDTVKALDKDLAKDFQGWDYDSILQKWTHLVRNGKQGDPCNSNAQTGDGQHRSMDGTPNSSNAGWASVNGRAGEERRNPDQHAFERVNRSHFGGGSRVHTPSSSSAHHMGDVEMGSNANHDVEMANGHSCDRRQAMGMG